MLSILYNKLHNRLISSRNFTSMFTIHRLYRKYKAFTMIPRQTFMDNLYLCLTYKKFSGVVVECGVWRGGMSAAIAELLGQDKKYYLFDSFEGLPQAQQIDGPIAKTWQDNTNDSKYFNNCKAEISFAQNAMKLSGVDNYRIVKGWFKDTLPKFDINEKISILRIDGDWYESTRDCLNYLYDRIESGGLLIIDDYYAWDGCALAVHDFLSSRRISDRIQKTTYGTAYIVKS